MRTSIVIIGLAILILVSPASATAQGLVVVRSEMIVSTDWLAERLDGKVILVHVGTAEEYASGHIPGARLLERREILTTANGIPNELPPVPDLEKALTRIGASGKERIVLYSFEPLLATRAWFTFDYLGQGHRTSVLNGGLAQWKAEDRPITTDVPVFEPLPFEAAPNMAVLTIHRAMTPLIRYRSSLGDALVVIDSRPAESYRGVTPGADIDSDRAGHIPGAINVPWTLNITDNGMFRGKDELTKLYAKIPMTRNTTVVTYCRTGVEASMTYFVLRYLGLDPTLYDGSYFEWSRDLSVATN